MVFDSPERQGRVLRGDRGDSLAFFAMVGFEDSVNMAEETKDPVRIFPKMMITGLAVTGVDLRAGRALLGGAGAGRRAGATATPRW